jgi:hypothetical protein
MRIGLTLLAAAAAAAALALPASDASAARASLSASVSRINCGEQAVDAGAKACGSVTFTNTASSSVQVGPRSIESNGIDFNVSSSTCIPVSVLGTGESCVIDLAFNPVTTGRRSAKLVLQENTFTTATSVRLVGFGTG